MTLLLILLLFLLSGSAQAEFCADSIDTTECEVEIQHRFGKPDKGVLQGSVDGTGYVALDAKQKSHYWLYVTSGDGVNLEDGKNANGKDVNLNESCSGNRHPDCQSLRERSAGTYYLKFTGTGSFKLKAIYRGTNEIGDAPEYAGDYPDNPVIERVSQDKTTLQYLLGNAGIGDRDWWKAELQARDYYVRTTNLSVTLAVYGSDGAEFTDTEISVHTYCQILKINDPERSDHWIEVSNDSESGQGYNLWLFQYLPTCY